MKNQILEKAPWFSQQKDSDSISFFVINISGANLYKEPCFNSKVVHNINVGTEIFVEEILKTKQSIHIQNEFYLEGNFIKINHDLFSGFVFSTDLTTFQPELENIYEGVMIPQFKGEEKSEKSEKNLEKFNNKEYEVEIKITDYDYITHTHTDFSICTEDIYHYKKMTLSEVYHQLTVHNPYINVTAKGNFIQIPKFIKENENEYVFEGIGITNSISILKNADGTFSISSLDCP